MDLSQWLKDVIVKWDHGSITDDEVSELLNIIINNVIRIGKNLPDCYYDFELKADEFKVTQSDSDPAQLEYGNGGLDLQIEEGPHEFSQGPHHEPFDLDVRINSIAQQLLLDLFTVELKWKKYEEAITAARRFLRVQKKESVRFLLLGARGRGGSHIPSALERLWEKRVEESGSENAKMILKAYKSSKYRKDYVKNELLPHNFLVTYQGNLPMYGLPVYGLLEWKGRETYFRDYRNSMILTGEFDRIQVDLTGLKLVDQIKKIIERASCLLTANEILKKLFKLQRIQGLKIIEAWPVREVQYPEYENEEGEQVLFFATVSDQTQDPHQSYEDKESKVQLETVWSGILPEEIALLKHRGYENFLDVRRLRPYEEIISNLASNLQIDQFNLMDMEREIILKFREGCPEVTFDELLIFIEDKLSKGPGGENAKTG